MDSTLCKATTHTHSLSDTHTDTDDWVVRRAELKNVVGLGNNLYSSDLKGLDPVKMAFVRFTLSM